METQYSKVVINDYKGDLSQRWYVYFSFQDPDSGKMKPFKFFISQKFKTRTSRFNEAARMRDEYKDKLKTGWTPFAKSGGEYTTLKKAIEHYLEVKSPPVLRKRTYDTYKSHLSFLQDYTSKVGLDLRYVNDFSKFDAEKFMQKTRINKKHSNRSHNNVLTTMRTVWTFFVKYEYCNRNVFQFVDTLMEEEPSIIPYTAAELSIISNNLPKYNERLWIIAQLIFYCFMRPQEIVRLKFENFNLIGGFVITPGGSSKNKKSEVIVIPIPLLNFLKTVDFESYQHNWYVFSKKLNPGPVEIAITRIDEAWMKFRDSVGGLGNKKIYWLKHTGNGIAADSGINIRDIQTHNRHSSLEYTQRYIMKLRPGSKKIAEQFQNMNPKLREPIQDAPDLNMENLIALLSKELIKNQSI